MTWVRKQYEVMSGKTPNQTGQINIIPRAEAITCDTTVAGANINAVVLVRMHSVNVAGFDVVDEAALAVENLHASRVISDKEVARCVGAHSKWTVELATAQFAQILAIDIEYL